MMQESECPECGTRIGQPSRCHDDGNEFRCPCCGMRHVRKEGDLTFYAFFPRDIEAAFDNDEKPFFDQLAD